MSDVRWPMSESDVWIICFTVTIFLIMTCYQLHATFFGSKRCPGGNTQAHPQTVQTVHLNEGRTPFCTVSSQKINKQTNTVSRSSSSQTMLEGVYGCFMTCNVFLAGNSEVSLELQCFTAELITYIVCECDAPEWQKSLNLRPMSPLNFFLRNLFAISQLNFWPL